MLVKSKSTPSIKVLVGSVRKHKRCRAKTFVSVCWGSGLPLLTPPQAGNLGTKGLFSNIFFPPFSFGPLPTPLPRGAQGVEESHSLSSLEQRPQRVFLSRSVCRPLRPGRAHPGDASWKLKDPSGNHLAWKQSHLVSDKLACKPSLIAAFKFPLKINKL